LFGQDDRLRNDDSFLDNGIIDSTGILELVGFLHERFGVDVEDQELVPENLDSIDRLVTYVQVKLRENGHAAAGLQ
jgi:acyl carrier protein